MTRPHPCPGVNVMLPNGDARAFTCAPDARTCTCFADALRFIRTEEWREIDDCRPKLGLYAVNATTGAELTQRARAASTGRPFPLDNFERRAARIAAAAPAEYRPPDTAIDIPIPEDLPA